MSRERFGITDAHYLCDSAIFNTETDEILRLYQICDLLNEQYHKIIVLEKALEMAVNELEDAKDMLRECGKNDWANTLNTSADYFKTKAKEMLNESNID